MIKIDNCLDKPRMPDKSVGGIPDMLYCGTGSAKNSTVHHAAQRQRQSQSQSSVRQGAGAVQVACFAEVCCFRADRFPALAPNQILTKSPPNRRRSTFLSKSTSSNGDSGWIYIIYENMLLYLVCDGAHDGQCTGACQSLKSIC